jgi:hypothetical protein
MDHITGREWGLLLLMDDVHHVVPAKTGHWHIFGWDWPLLVRFGTRR